MDDAINISLLLFNSLTNIDSIPNIQHDMAILINVVIINASVAYTGIDASVDGGRRWYLIINALSTTKETNTATNAIG